MSNLFSKQSRWSCAAAAGAFALFFAACGDEVTEVTEVTQVVGIQVVEEGDALPKCSADNEGAMVYSVDSAAAYYCINRKWTSMKGKDGKDGADGKDGKDGADGKNGKDGKNGTSESSSCTAKALKNGKGYKIVCGGDSVGVVLNGEDGQDGAKGDTGVAGTSCSAKKVSDGVKITCTDGKSFTLSNGADGKDGKSFVDGWMVDSRDKQLYRVVTIGEQTWMAENLNYKTENSWCGGGSDENEGDCSKYGRLYTWAAAVGKSEDECGYGKTCGLSGKVRGVCPEGWHLPDTTEWSKLFTAVGGKSTAGKKLKSLTGWASNGNGTDAYGFSAFPAGIRDGSGDFYNGGYGAYFWSATESDSNYAYGMCLYYYDGSASLDYDDKYDAFSVRCLKD